MILINEAEKGLVVSGVKGKKAKRPRETNELLHGFAWTNRWCWRDELASPFVPGIVNFYLAWDK